MPAASPASIRAPSTATRKRISAFADHCRLALRISGTPAEITAWQRAVEGVEQPFACGGEVHVRRRYSDGLLRLLLQGSNPKKYGPNPGFKRKRLLRHERKQMEREIRAALRANEAERGHTPEDCRRSITTKLEAIERHEEPKKLAAGWTKSAEGHWVPPGYAWVGLPEGADGPGADDSEGGTPRDSVLTLVPVAPLVPFGGPALARPAPPPPAAALRARPLAFRFALGPATAGWLEVAQREAGRWKEMEAVSAARSAIGSPARRARPRSAIASSCRRAAGGPSLAWAIFDEDKVEIVAGRLAVYASSPGVERGFCAACGTSLTYARANRPGLFDVTTASLDDPEAFPPTKEIWTEERLSWEAANPALPQYARFSPPGAAPE